MWDELDTLQKSTARRFRLEQSKALDILKPDGMAVPDTPEAKRILAGTAFGK